MTEQTITKTEFEERKVQHTEYICDMCGGEIDDPDPPTIESRLNGGFSENDSLVAKGHYHRNCMDLITEDADYHLLADGTLVKPVDGTDITTRVPWVVSKSVLLGSVLVGGYLFYEAFIWGLGALLSFAETSSTGALLILLFLSSIVAWAVVEAVIDPLRSDQTKYEQW